MRARTLVALLVVTVAGAAGLGAQQPLELRGRVVDATSGAPVAGADVRVDGVEGAAAISTRDGRWRIAGLSAGEHRLRVDGLGFAARTLLVTLPDAGGRLTVELQPQALPLDALVVTASRRMQRLADAPVTTELITRQDLERAGAADLSSVLVERAGIQLEGGHPAGEGVMLQGLGSERVLVLVDGQPMVGRISGQFDISRLPVSMIERVEVVKGPQSSLYGSEAMGGVVNVITRGAATERWNASIDLTAGSQARTDGSGTLRGTVGPFTYVLNGGRRATELTPGRADERGALAERWDGLVKVGWTPDASLTLEATVLAMDERQRWQSGQLFNFADNLQATAELGATWTAGAHRLAPAIYWTQFEHLSRRATSPEPVEGTGDAEIQRLIEGELLYTLDAGGRVLDLGIEAKREEIVSDRVTGNERALHTIEPFAQATWDLGAVSFVPGVRVTWSEQWGTHVTPRVSGLYRPVPELALRGSIGRGYRAPAFKELYMQFLNVGPGFGYTVRGNQDVTPETSTNLTAGAEWTIANAYVRAQLYYNRFDDFIETRLVGDSSGITVYTYGNIADGFTRGVELEGGVVAGRVRAEGGYAYLVARDARTDEDLLGRPAHSARLALETTLPLSARSAVTGVYTGRAPVQRTAEGGLVERSGFLRLDARLSRTFPGGVDLSLGARNLLDTRPEHWPGFSGRHLYLGLGWAMGGSAPAPVPP